MLADTTLRRSIGDEVYEDVSDLRPNAAAAHRKLGLNEGDRTEPRELIPQFTENARDFVGGHLAVLDHLKQGFRRDDDASGDRTPIALPVSRIDALDSFYEKRARTIGGFGNWLPRGGDFDDDEERGPGPRELADRRPQQQLMHRAGAPGGSEEPAPVRDKRQRDNAAEKARQQAEDNASHLDDYSDGRVAEAVDEAIASSTWFERLTGVAGAKIQRKGRYVWTRYGWVDLQHVISAATATNDPMLNAILGVGKEIEQGLGRNKSAFKREDILSNDIGAAALAYQRLVGGTIGQAIAHVLARYQPMTRQQAAEFLEKGGQAEPWP